MCKTTCQGSCVTKIAEANAKKNSSDIGSDIRVIGCPRFSQIMANAEELAIQDAVTMPIKQDNVVALSGMI